MSIVTSIAILESYRSTQDGTLKLTLALNEMKAENLAKVISLHNKSVVAVLSEGQPSKAQIQAIEDTVIEAPGKQIKSKSKQLRSVLYRLWEKTPNGFDSAEAHYEYMMSNIIEYYKQKIPD